ARSSTPATRAETDSCASRPAPVDAAASGPVHGAPADVVGVAGETAPSAPLGRHPATPESHTEPDNKPATPVQPPAPGQGAASATPGSVPPARTAMAPRIKSAARPTQPRRARARLVLASRGLDNA